MEMVTIYNLETKEKAEIPKDELSEGMVQVQIQGEDLPVWVSEADLSKTGLKQPPFEGKLKSEIESILELVSDVIEASYDEFEMGFRRSSDPESEVVVWRKVASTYNEFKMSMDINDFTDEDGSSRKLIIQYIMAVSSVGVDSAIEFSDNLPDGWGKEICEIYGKK